MRQLTPYQLKQALILQLTIQAMAKVYGLNYLAFLTLTFADDVQCPKEAMRRLNSVLTNCLGPRYGVYLRVFERCESGRIHYHFLVVMPFDIRTGVDFDAFAGRDYRTASKALRAEWSFLRKALSAYGFGRHELMPVYSSDIAAAKYLGKYLGQIDGKRDARDKGVRKLGYSRGLAVGNCNFQRLTRGTAEWRRKLPIFCAMVQACHPDKRVKTMHDLRIVLGPRWAYDHREFILSLE